MEPYRIFLHLDLLEAMPVRGESRKQIMRFIRLLAENPHMRGDYADLDESQRTQQIKIIDRYAVAYWGDDPVKTVMVVDVRLADR